jgi:hypothetical protein
MPKKKFAETKVGKFLKEKAPKILDKVADFLPDKGGLGILKNILDTDKELSPEDKVYALELLKADMEEMQEITKRWEADMKSDSWLSKNARPLVLLSAILMLYVFIVLDSIKIKFEIKESWIDLYEMMLVTTIGAYFSSRAIEKYHSRKYKD